MSLKWKHRGASFFSNNTTIVISRTLLKHSSFCGPICACHDSQFVSVPVLSASQLLPVCRRPSPYTQEDGLGGQVSIWHSIGMKVARRSSAYLRKISLRFFFLAASSSSSLPVLAARFAGRELVPWFIFRDRGGSPSARLMMRHLSCRIDQNLLVHKRPSGLCNYQFAQVLQTSSPPGTSLKCLASL